MLLLKARQSVGLASTFRASWRAVSTLPKTAQGLVYSEHGEPEKCLKLQEIPLPPVTAQSVVTETIYAPINPADINQVEGVYRLLPKLPAVGGNEGVSRVISVGEAVKGLKVGDWVIPRSAGLGSWRSHAVCTEEDLMQVASDIPAEYAASLVSNPSTAYRMLKDFVTLSPGDTVIQNGATSSVSRYIMQMTAAQGVQTINVVLDSLCTDEMIKNLKELGATHVVSESFAKSVDMKKLVSSLPNGKPKLAINNVGGKSSVSLIRTLAQGGTMVTYGGLSKQPVQVSTSSLIFNDVHIVGFWMTRWHQVTPLAERQAMLNELADMVRKGQLRNFFQLHDFDKFQDALAVWRSGLSEAKQMLRFSNP